MRTLTIAERCESYAKAFPQWSASHARVVREQKRDVALATWVIGNDYRNRDPLYGTYPAGYLARLLALFPETALDGFAASPRILHVYSGAVEPSRLWSRLDVNPERQPDIVGSVYDLPSLTAQRFFLVCADPPYSKEDAKRYGTPACDRKRAVAAIAEVVEPGGYLAWLDTCWPMHRKRQWVTVGRITVIRSTNHRVRLLSLFQRVA